MENCLTTFFKMLFSNNYNISLEENYNIEDKQVLKPNIKEIEPKFQHVKIIIDNGHGNNTAGKRSPYSQYKIEPSIDFYEYKWNREISKSIVNILKSNGYNADLLVTEEFDVSLTERANRVNTIRSEYGKDNVILISIHSNASGNGSKWMDANGWSAFTTKGNTKSDIIADYLYDEAVKNFVNRNIRIDMSDGDRDWENNFYICQKSKCPAVLTENFFYDNEEDVKYILSEKGKNMVIKTHVNAIIKYINDTY
jgi:N-acetylmuramoyl-L-alanine amidase